VLTSYVTLTYFYKRNNRIVLKIDFPFSVCKGTDFLFYIQIICRKINDFLNIFITFAAKMTEKEANEIARWYVLGIHGAHQEIKLRDALRQAGMESYVLLKYEIVRKRDIQQRRMLPAIAGLVFVKTCPAAFKEFAMRWTVPLFLRKSSFSNHEEYLTISQQQMEQFIAVGTAFPESITYFKPEEVTLHEGERVRIQIGTKSYEAEIKRVKGKRSKQLVVEIPEVTTATITLTPDIMNLITQVDNKGKAGQQQQHERQKKQGRDSRQTRRPYKNLEADKKILFDMSRRLLFEVTPEHMEDPENQMALLDLKRIHERVAGAKGVIPATEGELALAVYLASVLLKGDVQQSTERLKNSINMLKDSSLLRMRMQLFLAKLSGDQQTLEGILKEVKTWNKLRLTVKQKVIVEDVRMMTR
jgi:predicted DNA-binding antitoxin AbrB/MazE fold protein